MNERGTTLAGPFVPAALVVLAVLAFLPALGIGFFRDDFGWVKGAIEGTRDVSWVLEPAKTDFRPIPKLSMLANLLVSGIDPRGYALFNVLVHAANVLLLWALALRLTRDRRAAFVAATLFAVGAGHYGEAVYWMSGRTGLLADLWCLGALLAYDRWLLGGRTRDGLLAFACFGLGLLTKESAVVLPFVLFALEWMRRNPVLDAARRLAPYGALAVFYLVFEFWILRSDSGVVGGDFALGPHMVRNFGEYFARMVIPLTPSSMLVTVPAGLVPVLGAVLGALTVVAPLAVLAVAVAPKAPRTARFGAVWAMLAILPYVALTFRTSTRYLYGPAQGMALVAGTLAALALDRAWARSSRVGQNARVAALVLLAALVAVEISVLAVSMDRRRALQRAESGPAQAELEALARRRGIVPPKP